MLFPQQELRTCKEIVSAKAHFSDIWDMADEKTIRDNMC